MTSNSQPNLNKNDVGFILWVGLLVGSLDIIAAFVDVYLASGNGPAGVLRYIASGVFGNEAFSGGSMMIVWGLIFHFIIAFSFTIFFFWLYPRIRAMRRYPVLTAILYAIFMWAITARIVVPLSHAPGFGPIKIWKALKAVTILTIMIGLPLSFIMRRRFKYGQRQSISEFKRG